MQSEKPAPRRKHEPPLNLSQYTFPEAVDKVLAYRPPKKSATAKPKPEQSSKPSR